MSVPVASSIVAVKALRSFNLNEGDPWMTVLVGLQPLGQSVLVERSTRPQVPFCATGRAPPTKPSAEHFRAPDPLHYASYVVRDSDVMGRHCRVVHDYQWRAGAGAAERSLLLREYEESSRRFGGVRSVDVPLPLGHCLLIKDFLAAVGRDGQRIDVWPGQIKLRDALTICLGSAHSGKQHICACHWGIVSVINSYTYT